MEFIEIGKAMAELTTTTVIIAAVIYLLIKYFSNIIDGKIVKKEKIDEIDHLELGSLQALKQLHPYFNKVDNLIEVKLPITKIGGPVRTLIFRDVLKIFYETGKETFNNLLDENITKENFLQKAFEKSHARCCGFYHKKLYLFRKEFKIYN